MKIIKILILFSFIAPRLFGAELTMTVTGIDKFPIYDKVDEENIFMIYTNRYQFTTNTALFGFGTCDGTIEMIKGQQHQAILCAMTDSYGYKGYFKAIPPEKKKIIGNMLGDRIGSSIASWVFTGGEGPFSELKGVILTGAYFQMGNNRYEDGNFIWRAKAEGISDKLLERLNGYSSKKN